MIIKSTLLSSAAVALVLSIGAAQAQAPAKNDDMSKPPASSPSQSSQTPAEKQKPAMETPRNAEPSKSDATKSGSMGGREQNAQGSPRATTGQSSPSDSSKSNDMKASDSASGSSSNDNQTGSRSSDHQKAPGNAASGSSAQAPQTNSANKAAPNADAAKGTSGGSNAAQSSPGGTDANRAAAAGPNLNKEQETKISAAVSSTKVQPVTNVNFSLSVGTAVPSHVHLQPLPASIVSIVPEYRGYDFFVVREEIVIVEPRTHKIVRVIERSGPSRASAATSEKIRLSDQDRAVLRRSVHGGRATTGSSRSVERVTVGERLPTSVEITEFPDEVYQEVPAVRSYRYYRTDRGLFLVNPSDRTVIEEIE